MEQEAAARLEDSPCFFQGFYAFIEGNVLYYVPQENYIEEIVFKRYAREVCLLYNSLMISPLQQFPCKLDSIFRIVNSVNLSAHLGASRHHFTSSAACIEKTHSRCRVQYGELFLLDE